MANKTPFDETTNYDDVYRIVKLMRGDIVTRGKNGNTRPASGATIGAVEPV